MAMHGTEVDEVLRDTGLDAVVQDLVVTPENLDRSVSDYSATFFRISAQLVLLRQDADRAGNELKEVMARRRLVLGEAEKVRVKDLDAQVEADPDVVRARETRAALLFEVSVLEGLLDAWRTKDRRIRDAVELSLAGMFTAAGAAKRVVAEDARAEMAKKRGAR